MTSGRKHEWPRRGYADGPYGQIHFQDMGDGEPLALLHQAPMASGQFDNVFAPLAQRGLRAIAIDMPGFGLSDPTGSVPTIRDYAHVVPPVLDALGIISTAVLGHHTGALVATEAAIRFPERISALIVNSPLIATDADYQDFMSRLHRWELDYTPRAGAAHMVELFEIRNQLAHGAISPDRLSDYVVQSLVGRGAFWHGHHAAYTYRLEEALPNVAQPGLILTNTGDMICDHAGRAHALRPDFALMTMTGGGIDIVDEQPEAWADAVAAFLGSVRSVRTPAPSLPAASAI